MKLNTIPHKRWTKTSPPKRILAIRFQALGDLVITLPYLQDLKRQYPDTKLDLLTRQEVSAIPQAIDLFDEIIVIGGGRNAKFQLLLSLLRIPSLWLAKYDMVLDLQNHRISRIIRRLIGATAWVEFDRESPIAAGERTRISIEQCWHWKIKLDTSFRLQYDNADTLLRQNGWKENHRLVVLNPAGFCKSRNWPMENYAAFAKLWRKEIDPMSQFVLLLMPAHEDKAQYLSETLGDACIDLTGKANQVAAFSVLKKANFVLSEDSGLMHMAWIQGVPTLALFSSSKAEWSAPQGERSRCLDSADLSCGPCMQEVCQFGDNRCLTRYTPAMVIAHAKEMIQESSIAS